MNERIKELARQAKPKPNVIWEDAELERFAEFVRQDYLRELKELKPVAWQVMDKTDALREFSIKDIAQDWITTELLRGSSTVYWIRPLYTAPPRKEWVGLTNEDWENTPDTGKRGCERDVEMFDWIEKTLKDKNDTL